MRLHENQLKLIRHLARFNLLDYAGCLHLLDTERTGDQVALSYAFRPLTKNKYLTKRKDGSVSILAKGRGLFPDIKPLISAGGGERSIQRVIEVSRMAALMEEHGIPAVAEVPKSPEPVFIPSACWRSIAPGILSTTRFTGMIVAGKEKLAVYDIEDGSMEWQVRAEGSLFYTKYGSYETKATGMLLVCWEDSRIKAAQNIVRQTMWSRRQLLREDCMERDRPTRWSRSPIKLRAQYEHVYLTTPETLGKSLRRIQAEEKYIQALSKHGGRLSGSQGIGDIEAYPRHVFVNPACDLLKFVRFFVAVKSYLVPKENEGVWKPQIMLELIISREDAAIAKMYPALTELEGVFLYVFKS